MSALGEIGASPPVDWLPLLKYIPERFWGHWRTRAARLRQQVLDLHGPLVDRVVERRARRGHATATTMPTTFLDGVLDQQEKLRLSRTEIDIMCGNLVEGGSDTMATTTLTFFQAMVTYPRWQAEAQQEIDAVLGDHELPSWTDCERLPTVAMIVKEVLRWRPPAPGLFPHCLTKGMPLFPPFNLLPCVRECTYS